MEETRTIDEYPRSQDREFKCDDKGIDITVTDDGKSQHYTLLCDLPLGHGGTIHKNECVSWKEND